MAPQLLHEDDFNEEEPVNFTILFKSISDSNWTSAIERLRTNPVEAEIWTIRKTIHGEISWLRLPLHEACIRAAPSNLVEALIKVYPNGSMGRDQSGRIPLHHAAIHGASPETISLLLEAFPSSAEENDSFNKTPTMCLMPSSQYNLDSDIGEQNNVLNILSRDPAYHQKAAELRNQRERRNVSGDYAIGTVDKKVAKVCKNEKEKIHKLEKELSRERKQKEAMLKEVERMTEKANEVESSLLLQNKIIFRVKAEKFRSEAHVKRLQEEKTELQEKFEGVNDRCQQVEAEFLQQNRDMLSLHTMISSLQENLLRVKDRSLRIKNRFINSKIDFSGDEKESLSGDVFSYSQDKPTFIRIIDYDASTDVSVGDSSTISSLKAKVRGRESQVSLALLRAKLHSR